MSKAVQETTGRGTSPAEKRRWAEVAEVLATELKIAAGRTTVSSAPAFLAEHLRRRLWKKEKAQIEAEAAERMKSSPAAKSVNAAECADFFKGVAKCGHQKLKVVGSPAQQPEGDN